MSELQDNQEPKIPEVYGIFESIRRGTPYMTEHLKKHEPGDPGLHRHKIANGIASAAMLGISSFGLMHTVPNAVNEGVDASHDQEFSVSRAFDLAGYTSLMMLEAGGMVGGLLLGANAQAVYRKQQEGVMGENNSDQATG